MILVKVPFVEELLKQLLVLSSPTPVLILRKGRKLVILTELGNVPMVFVSTIPRERKEEEVEEVYRSLTTGTFIYIDENGRIVASHEYPGSRAMSSLGIVLDVRGILIGEDALRELRRLLGTKPSRERVHGQSVSSS